MNKVTCKNTDNKTKFQNISVKRKFNYVVANTIKLVLWSELIPVSLWLYNHI